MELTTEQSQALDRMLEWFGKNKRDSYRLSGYAGTGKSYLVGKFLKSIGREPRVYCLAPSHKARRNLQGLIDGNGVDWIECVTVARFLGQSPKLNEETGLDEFVSDDGERVYADLVIADEYSMLSSKNLADIEHKYSGKLMFVGDPAQLPPVGEKRSPVLGLSMNESQLITSVRFTGEIGTVSASYRSTNPQDWLPIDSTDGTIVKFDRQAWFDDLVAKTQAGLTSGKFDDCKAIVFRNKTAETWNDRIRLKIWGEHARAYEIGDRLIARKPLFRKTEEYTKNRYCHFSRRYLPIAENSMEFTVTGLAGIDSIKLDAKVYEFNTIPVKPDEGKEICLQIPTLAARGAIESDLRQARTNADWALVKDLSSFFDDVVFSYVVTCHKAQGSTFRATYLDLKDLRVCPDRSQMLYTALTRASEYVAVF
jgi:hypothetical protein